MKQSTFDNGEQAGQTEHVDVLIVGASISGIGAVFHLRRQCPGMSCAVLEANDSYGGTWLTHRFPGIRSDSDLYTFGYAFKPWTGAPIATAQEILRYLGEVIEENDLARHIRYGHRIESAHWSSAQKLWTLTVTCSSTGETRRFTTGFLCMCQGYYRHWQGYTPQWEGMAAFNGVIAHPESWPEDLDCKSRRVVVIGSGATAATLIPAIAMSAPTSPCGNAPPRSSGRDATPFPSRTSCARWVSRRNGSTRSCGARSPMNRTCSPSARLPILSR